LFIDVWEGLNVRLAKAGGHYGSGEPHRSPKVST